MTAASQDPQHQVQRVKDYFAGAQGKERYLALLFFTERQVRSMHWCVSTSDGSIPGGQRACDIVNETVQADQSDAAMMAVPWDAWFPHLPARPGTLREQAKKFDNYDVVMSLLWLAAE